MNRDQLRSESALAGRFVYASRVRVRGRSIAWLAQDRETDGLVVCSPVRRDRVDGLGELIDERVRGLAPILHVAQSPAADELPRDFRTSRSPVGVARYVPGETLQERLTSGEVPAVEAVRLIARVAGTVAHLHQKGICHGAISSRSVVLTPADDPEAGPILSMLLVPPSATFASPERKAGQPASFEDDCYALLALLYVALTGHVSFARSAPNTLRWSDIDLGLRALVEGGMTDSVERRPNAKAIARRLRAWLDREAARTNASDDELDSMVPSGPPTERLPTARAARSPEPPRPRSTMPPPAAPSARPRLLSDLVLETSMTMNLGGKALGGPATPPAPGHQAPPTIRPSVSTVHPRPKRSTSTAARHATTLFWGALAVGFGASAAAVYWEIEVESRKTASLAGEWSETPSAGTKEDRVGALDAYEGLSTFAASKNEGAASKNEGTSGSEPGAADSLASDERHSAEVGRPLTEDANRLECASRFFSEGAFPSDAISASKSPAPLSYLCDETDLRNVKAQIGSDLARQARGKTTPPVVEWGTLGWYQLPMTAAIRQDCCPRETTTASLPEQHGVCAGLTPSIDELITAEPGTLAFQEKSQEYTDRVRCLFRAERDDVYAYRFRPSAENRDAFANAIAKGRSRKGTLHHGTESR